MHTCIYTSRPHRELPARWRAAHVSSSCSPYTPWQLTVVYCKLYTVTVHSHSPVPMDLQQHRHLHCTCCSNTPAGGALHNRQANAVHSKHNSPSAIPYSKATLHTTPHNTTPQACSSTVEDVCCSLMPTLHMCCNSHITLCHCTTYASAQN